MNSKELINKRILDLGFLLKSFSEENKSNFSKIAEIFIDTLKKNNTIFWCGNGGSAAESSHLAAELIGRFRSDRTPLPSVSLNSDNVVLTGISNDFGYENVFSRQLKALAKKGDLLICLSTSGKSENIIRALEEANFLGISTISLLGAKGGKALGLSNLSIVIDSTDTARIQEIHLMLGHVLCEYAESQIFSL
jgi:D-sedoheptulose 7-phosphate isomerase